MLHVRVTLNLNAAAVLSEETQADWNCWQVCWVTPAGRSATAGDGTPPPVTAVAVDTGTSVADVPGAAALGLVPVVCEMLKVSLLLGRPPARNVHHRTWPTLLVCSTDGDSAYSDAINACM